MGRRAGPHAERAFSAPAFSCCVSVWCVNARRVGMFCLLAVNTAWYGALASRLNTLCGGAWWYDWNVPTTCGPAPWLRPRLPLHHRLLRHISTT